MRSAKSRTSKKIFRRRTGRTNQKRRSRGMWSNKNAVSLMDFNNINEVLRVIKTQRTTGKGSWKVVPKDSCEVYKDRRKRQTDSERRKEDEDSYKSDEAVEQEVEKKERKPRNKQQNGAKSTKDTNSRGKGKKRTLEYSSPSASSSSLSTSMSTSSSSLCEMDYD